MKKKVKSQIREWVESIAIALILALVIRTFFFQAFKIPTGSMRPTLIEGDRILVNKISYRFREPEIGEIIVFRHHLGNKEKDFIKRLIAKEEDRVEIKYGNIFVNGEILKEPPILKKFYYYNRGPYGEKGAVVYVTEDALFVLGDNSSASMDSRFWGLIPRENVVGRAFLIYWPLTRIRILQ